MTRYAANFTSRYVVRYSSAGRIYSVGFRFTDDTPLPPAAVIPAVEAIINALRPWRWNDWTVLGATWRRRGSDVTVPVEPPTVLSGQGGNPGTGNLANRTQYVSFIGRTFAGSRCAIFFYGVNQTGHSGGYAVDFRVTANENPVVGATLQALADADNANLCGIDGGGINWYPYANLGYNSYQIKKARG